MTHLFLPSLTVVSPCRALPFKNSLEEISFPPWEEGRGSFEGNSIFAISPDRLSPESGGKRLPPFVFPVRFPPLRLFSLLAVSSFLPTLSSVYFSFLFLSFFRFRFFFFFFFSFSLSLPFLLSQIDRKRARFRLLASNFLTFTTSPLVLFRGRLFPWIKPLVPRYVLTNLRSIIPLFDDLFINVNRKFFFT